MESVDQLCRELRIASGDPDTNKHGNAVYRVNFRAERYMVDFADKFTEEGWLQFDTDQDAPYFGLWVNPKTFTTLCYCEGDWTVVDCGDREHYNAEISDAIRFYGEGFICKAMGADGVTTYVQDRQTFLIA